MVPALKKVLLSHHNQFTLLCGVRNYQLTFPRVPSTHNVTRRPIVCHHAPLHTVSVPRGNDCWNEKLTLRMFPIADNIGKFAVWADEEDDDDDDDWAQPSNRVERGCNLQMLH